MLICKPHSCSGLLWIQCWLLSRADATCRGESSPEATHACCDGPLGVLCCLLSCAKCSSGGLGSAAGTLLDCSRSDGSSCGKLSFCCGCRPVLDASAVTDVRLPRAPRSPVFPEDAAGVNVTSSADAGHALELQLSSSWAMKLPLEAAAIRMDGAVVPSRRCACDIPCSNCTKALLI